VLFLVIMHDGTLVTYCYWLQTGRCWCWAWSVNAR